MTQTTQSNEFVANGDGLVRSNKTAWRHIRSEYTDSVPQILATLAPEGPYAYTANPDFREPGEPIGLTFVSTYEDIKTAYENMHRWVGVRDMDSIVEIQGDWYSFMYGRTESINLETNVTNTGLTGVLFPTLGQDGITGEMIWPMTAIRTDTRTRGDISDNLRVLARLNEFLDMLRTGDVDSIAKASYPNIQVGIRDYVNDTRSVTGVFDAAGHRDYLASYYARFNVQSIDLVQRYVADWFAFSELRWTADDTKTGHAVEYHTIEITDINDDGVIRGRIGHGTDPKTL